MVASNSDMFTHYMPVAFLTSYLKSSWVTRGRFIVLAPKKYDIVGAAPIAYGQSHLGIKCNDTVLVCYVGNIKPENTEPIRIVTGGLMDGSGGGQRSGELGI